MDTNETKQPKIEHYIPLGELAPYTNESQFEFLLAILLDVARAHHTAKVTVTRGPTRRTDVSGIDAAVAGQLLTELERAHAGLLKKARG